jgi:hypothetical protein
MTMAERIASLLHGDGTCWQTDDGRTLDDLLREEGAEREHRGSLEQVGSEWRSEYERHVLPDGSAILTTPTWWDIEGSQPWCRAGHEEDGPIGAGVD